MSDYLAPTMAILASTFVIRVSFVVCHSSFALTWTTALLLLSGCRPDSTPQDLTAWPTQPISISCFAAAGGGTDVICRLTARELERELGVKINVVNRTGGRGGESMNYVNSRTRDGYHWGGFAESVLTGAVLGITQTTAKDWSFFIVAGAPGVLSVATDSRFQNLEQLVAAAKVKFKFIPFNRGSQPSQMATLSGEVDAVLTSISEQAELIQGNRLRPLTMIEGDSYDFSGYGVIPAAATAYPTIREQPVDQFLGIALPSDTPPEILEKVTIAFESFVASDALKSFCAQQHLNLLGIHGEVSKKLCRNIEINRSWKLHELGIAIRSPEEFDIPKNSENDQ